MQTNQVDPAVPRRLKQLLQYLLILAVFALVWFTPLEKPRPANPGAVPNTAKGARR